MFKILMCSMRIIQEGGSHLCKIQDCPSFEEFEGLLTTAGNKSSPEEALRWYVEETVRRNHTFRHNE